MKHPSTEHAQPKPPRLHTYPIGTRDDPYRLTRVEKHDYETGWWLGDEG